MSVATKLQIGDDCAWVSCDGKPLPVYGAETSGNKTTAWIPSEAGKAFTVTIECPDSENTIAARTYVDGAWVCGHLMGKDDDAQWVVEGATAGATAERPMHFTAIKTSDDESHCMAPTTLAKLGKIVVEFSRVEVAGPCATPDHTNSLNTSVAVHEKQKKLGGHHATLGAPKQLAKAIPFFALKDLDPAPRTILEFKYRPKDLLQAQGIIPVVRAPSPVILPRSQTTKRPLDDSSDPSSSQHRELSVKRAKQEDPEYTRRLEEHIRQLRSQLPGDHPLLDNSPVKSESTEINAHKFFKKGEIIDLTDD